MDSKQTNHKKGITGANSMRFAVQALPVDSPRFKFCIRCHAEKPLNDFYIRTDTDKRRGYCRTCEAIAREKIRKLNLHKDNAKCKAKYAERTGRLVNPGKCEKCPSAKNIQKHHDDYDKPLDVRWLCAKCHCRHHAEMRKKVG